jgi:hypothetical protein
MNRKQAARLRALAEEERGAAALLRRLGAVYRAERRALDAQLHEDRARAFEAAAERAGER